MEHESSKLELLKKAALDHLDKCQFQVETVGLFLKEARRSELPSKKVRVYCLTLLKIRLGIADITAMIKPEAVKIIDKQIDILKDPPKARSIAMFKQAFGLVVAEIQRKLSTLRNKLEKACEEETIISTAHRINTIYKILDTILQAREELSINAENLIVTKKCWAYVKVAEAKDLPTKDSEGTRDPYVIITVDGKKLAKTKTKKKTLSPCWLQEFNFPITPDSQELNFLVYDKDSFGSDDLIGQVAVHLNILNATGLIEKWFKLEKKRSLNWPGNKRKRIRNNEIDP